MKNRKFAHLLLILHDLHDTKCKEHAQRGNYIQFQSPSTKSMSNTAPPRARTKIQISIRLGQQDNSNALPPGQSHIDRCINNCCPVVVLPIMAYSRRLRPKGVPFSGFRHIKGQGIHRLGYIKGQGNWSLRYLKGPLIIIFRREALMVVSLYLLSTTWK